MSNKKTPPIKILRGGSTGLVQQNLKSYPKKPKKPKEEYVYIFIKDTLKKKFGSKKPTDYDGRMPYILTWIHEFKIKSMIKEFQKENIKYAILDIVPNTDPVMRKVTASSDPSTIGFKI